MGSSNSTSNPDKIYPGYIYDTDIPQNPKPEDPTLKDLLVDPGRRGDPENGQYRIQGHDNINLPNIEVWRGRILYLHQDFGWQHDSDYDARKNELRDAMSVQWQAREKSRRARIGADAKAFTGGRMLADALDSLDAAEATERSANARVTEVESRVNAYHTQMMQRSLEEMRVGRMEAWRERQRQLWAAPENELERKRYEAEWYAEQNRLQQQRDADIVVESERQREEDRWRADRHARWIAEDDRRRREALRRGEEEYQRRQQPEAERRQREEAERREAAERRAREEANSRVPFTEAENAHKRTYEAMWGKGTWTRQAYRSGWGKPKRPSPRGHRRAPTPPRRRRSRTPTPPRQDPDYYTSQAQRWLEAISAAFADYESMTSFPIPPHRPCRNPSCEMTASTRALKACTCNIRDCFSILDDKQLKSARTRLHPDKFSRCREDLRDAFQAIAQILFVVVDDLWRKR